MTIWKGDDRMSLEISQVEGKSKFRLGRGQHPYCSARWVPLSMLRTVL
jgi:hypothetical protein